MRAAKFVYAATAILILATAGGYFGLDYYTRHQVTAGVDQALAMLPAGVTARYQGARLSPISNHIVVSGLTLRFAVPGQAPQPFEVAIDSLEVANLNPDLSTLATRDPVTMGRETAVPIADAIIVSGLHVNTAMAQVTQDAVRVEKPRAYPWFLTHGGSIVSPEFQAVLAHGPGPLAPEDVLTLLRVEASALLGIAYDHYDAGPMTFTARLPGTSISYGVNHVSGDGYDRGMISAMTAEGIAVSGGKLGSMTLDRITFGQTDLRGPLVRVFNREPLSAALLNGLKFGRIEYAGMTMQSPGLPATRFGGMWVGPVSFAQGVPVTGEIGLKDIAISKGRWPDPRLNDAFNKLALDTLTISFSLAYDWDVGRKRITLRDTMLRVNELGTLTLAAELANVEPELTGLAAARLARARLRFDDASLVGRLVTAGAMQSGVDAVTYRRQIADMVLRQSNPTPGVVSPVMTAAARATGDFIGSPQSLTIDLAPPAPVPLTTFSAAAAAPASLLTILGVTVTANQP